MYISAKQLHGEEAEEITFLLIIKTSKLLLQSKGCDKVKGKEIRVRMQNDV